MKALTTLIKLHKRQLDGLRRKMASLERQKSQLQLVSARLSDELAREMKLAGEQPEMTQFFGDFARRIKRRQEDITSEIAAIDTQMAALNEDISAEFSEMKKIEIAKAAAKRLAQVEEKRQDTIMLDEVAERQHRRKDGR
ncbi:MAG: flagellar FliJ family protein [Pseudomonadota bacterium]|nr:flagellar FliJ family protein [Pseudomonadota bacterium]